MQPGLTLNSGDPSALNFTAAPAPTFYNAGSTNTGLSTPYANIGVSTPQTLGLNTTANGGGGSYASGSIGASPGMGDQLKQLYDAQVGGLQNQLGGLDSNKALDAQSVQGLYNPQYQSLTDQHQTGLQNLDLGQQQLDTNHSNSLRDLGNNLRQLYNSFSNQLGTQGAGFSSAGPMVAYGLQQQANTGKGDIENQFGTQQTGLNVQRHGLDQGFQDQWNMLNGQKQAQLESIASNYQQRQNQLQQAIGSAQGDEARYLSLYGQTALANQAIADLKATESHFADQAGQLHQQYQQVQAPGVDISKYAGMPSVAPISTNALSGQSLNGLQSAPTNNSPIALSLQRKPSDNLGY